jgi:DNA-directed RNA polymerase III subunit RPC6
MIQANVSKVELSLKEIKQVLRTLVYDYVVDEEVDTSCSDEETIYVPSKRITVMCDFKDWDVLSPDFHFRNVRYDDGVVLSAHEPHYHS